MKANIRKSIATRMAEDYSDPTHIDRSKCWKPVRAVIKGNATATSPIIEGLRKTADIAEFWRKYYTQKLNATEGPLPINPTQTQRLCV
jgi:hypothetical protein